MFSTTDCGYYWHRVYPFANKEPYSIESSTVDKISFADISQVLSYFIVRAFEQVFIVRYSSEGYTAGYWIRCTGQNFPFNYGPAFVSILQKVDLLCKGNSDCIEH